jgi:hypothetical protein
LPRSRSVAAYSSIDVPLTGRGEPQQLPALDVSPDFFATLGVNPARGRAFLTGAAAPDDQPEGEARRQHADDGAGNAVDGEGLSDDRRIGPERSRTSFCPIAGPAAPRATRLSRCWDA